MGCRGGGGGSGGGVMGCELAGLHVKCALSGKSFTVSKNWLALGGSVPPSQQGPGCPASEIQNTYTHKKYDRYSGPL